MFTMQQGKYCLTWPTYSDHMKGMMKELMMNEDFSDVTLVTEDKKQINANISVLSACSPVFKDVLKNEKNTNQIMYLRGIQYSEMESIMQFIYLGEATFHEERMDEFLAVAKLLEIKQLCNAGEAIDESDHETSPSDDLKTSTVEQNLSANIVWQATQHRPRELVGLNRKYECEQCDKAYTTPGALKLHNQSAHEGVKYSCYHCDYQGTTQQHVARHIQSKHDCVKYYCDHCDFQATREDHLNKHIKSQHEGVTYDCDQCHYQAKREDRLTRHIQLKHEGVKYPCDQCVYHATRKDHLTRHIQSKHGGVKYSSGLSASVLQLLGESKLQNK